MFIFIIILIRPVEKSGSYCPGELVKVEYGLRIGWGERKSKGTMNFTISVYYLETSLRF